MDADIVLKYRNACMLADVVGMEVRIEVGAKTKFVVASAGINTMPTDYRSSGIDCITAYLLGIQQGLK